MSYKDLGMSLKLETVTKYGIPKKSSVIFLSNKKKRNVTCVSVLLFILLRKT